MAARQKFFAGTTMGLLLASLFVGMASAGSHYPLGVTLWNDSADGLLPGQTFTAWAQVLVGDVPTNGTAVMFQFGWDIPVIAPLVNYPATYAGSPGLYKATITIAPFDRSAG